MGQAFQKQYTPGALVSAAVSSEQETLGKFINLDWKTAWSESIKTIQDAVSAYKSKHPEAWSGSKEQIKEAAGFFLSYLIEHGYKDAQNVSLIAESTLNKNFDCDMFVLRLADFMMGIGVPPQELKFVHIEPSRQSYEPHKLLKVRDLYVDILITDIIDKKKKSKETKYEMLVMDAKELDKRQKGRRVEIEPWRQSEKLNRYGMLDRLNLLLKDRKDEFDKIRAEYKEGQDNSQVYDKMHASLNIFISTAYAGAQLAVVYSKDEPEHDYGFWRAGQYYLQMAYGYSIFSSTHMDKLNYAKEALTWLEKAVAINPTNADNYALLGNVHELLGETDKAREEYQKFLKLADPHDPSLKEVKAWLKKNKKK